MPKSCRWSLHPPRRRTLLIGFLLLTNAITGALLGRAWWRALEAKNEIFAMATYAGALQADEDFNAGLRREYELVPHATSGPTGRHDGVFEIWTWPYYPELGPSDLLANKSFVNMFNDRMKYMEKHPEQFREDKTFPRQPRTKPDKTPQMHTDEHR